MNINGVFRRTVASGAFCIALGTLAACTESQQVESPSPVAAKSITGTAFYLEATSGALVIHAVHAGKDTTDTVAVGSGDCPANSAVLSPDHRQLA